MSQRTICDGCGKELKPSGVNHAIHGERADGMGGGGLPRDEFDWCTGCAQIAFAAVERARQGADDGS